MKIIYDLKTQKLILDIPADELLSAPREVIDEAALLYQGMVGRLKKRRVAVKRAVKRIGNEAGLIIGGGR